MKIVWSPLALDRASEIVDYISQDKPTAAESWIEIIFTKVETLESSPEVGRIVHEIGDGKYRELLHGNYRIIYRIGYNEIAILTIRHGKQILPVDEILGGNMGAEDL